MPLLQGLMSFFAATPENPRFSLNDPAAWDQFLGGEPSSSGVNVTRETALTDSAWWRGVNLIGRDVATLPVAIYRMLPNGKERDTNHPSYRFVAGKPNEYQTSLQFRLQQTGHAVGGGNGYSYIFRNGDGSVREILPLDPDSTYPVKENGKLMYVTHVAGEIRKLFPEDVLHIKGLGFDGMQGYGCYEKAREELGLSIGSRKYSAIFFRNNARPPTILEHPVRLDKKVKDQLREEWERANAGLDNAHRAAILDGGLKATFAPTNARDSQLIERQKFSILAIANFLNLPPHKLGDSSRTSYNSLEQEERSYLREGLNFWLCAWEDELDDKLLTEEQKAAESHAVYFDRQPIEQADLTTRAAYYAKALAGRGWMRVNEARITEGLDADDDPASDEIPAAPGAAPVDGKDEPPPPPKKPKPDQADDGDAEARAQLLAAHRELLADVTRRMTRRIGTHAERAAKDPKTFGEWIDHFAAEHATVLAEAFEPIEAIVKLRNPNRYGTVFWFTDALKEDYLKLSGSATAKTLAASVAALVKEQPDRLAQGAVDCFLDDMEAT